jgi:POT family proton-dependent oligopeptide transporter
MTLGTLLGRMTTSQVSRHMGFVVAFAIPTKVFLNCAAILYFCGHRRKWIKATPPAGVPVLGPSLKLVWRGARGRWYWNSVATMRHMSDGTFWTDVKRVTLGTRRPGWMVWGDEWIEEVAREWRVCGVLLWLP